MVKLADGVLAEGETMRKNEMKAKEEAKSTENFMPSGLSAVNFAFNFYCALFNSNSKWCITVS